MPGAFKGKLHKQSMTFKVVSDSYDPDWTGRLSLLATLSNTAGLRNETKSELREVRPYAGVDDIQDALSDLKLEFGGAVVEQAGRTTVSGRAYLRDRVGLRVAHDDEAEIFVKRLTAAVEQADLEAAQCELVVVASTSRLKISDVVWRSKISELGDLGPVVELATPDNRPRALQTPFGTFSVDVYVLLQNRPIPAHFDHGEKGPGSHESGSLSHRPGRNQFQPNPVG